MVTDALVVAGADGEQALRQVADALPHAVFLVDEQGRIRVWNAAAERITGYSRSQALGARCSLLHGEGALACTCGAGPLVCGVLEQPRAKRCTMRARDGRALEIVKNAVALNAPDGRFIGALEAFAEVTPPAQPVPDRGIDGLVGSHPAMRELQRILMLVARSDATVLIMGESGCGKERAAETIHSLSPRAARPFVRVSCSALNENLLESELFGHVRGAFTGAHRDRTGRFVLANGGTLLLDEIGDISPAVQVKLLRVIEQREIEPVGESRPVKIDVRLLCATHRDLRQLVAEGRFRADLYFRLAVFPVRVPALREHATDVPALAEHFLARTGHRGGISVGALQRLMQHPWPGNVRELQNVLQYSALRAGGAEILPEHLPAELGEQKTAASPCESLRDSIERALALHGGSRTLAAKALGISRVTLWKRMKRLGMVP